MTIYYKKGYKYQLAEDYVHALPFSLTDEIDITLIQYRPGKLILSKGYAWDGPSGPAIDTKNFMRGSLIHDAGYQLMREKIIEAGEFRDKFDRELQRICREDGMSWIRAQWVYWAVKTFAKRAAIVDRPIIKAP